MSKNESPRVLVYRNDLLEQSETFIAAQSSALRRYQPVFCGLKKRTNSLLSKTAQTTILARENGALAKLQRLAYLEAGFAPAWIGRVARHRALLMHAHFALDGACALPLLKQLRIPLVVTLHGYDVTNTDTVFQQSRAGQIYLRRREELFARAHTFICVSEFIRQKALQAGFPPEKLWVHSIGINLEDFQSGAAPISPVIEPGNEGAPLVLFVGRLVEKKGCIHLLYAIREVQRSHPNARLIIIGDGPLRSALEKTARELALTGCRFLGAQPATVIRDWLRQTKVFSVPSVTAINGDSEGLGMVFCEAQAMGIPVVSFATGGIPEAVADGLSGLLVREKDEPALARAILTLLNDPALWIRMAEHGKQRMAERFDLRKQTVLLEARYDMIVASFASQQA